MPSHSRPSRSGPATAPRTLRLRPWLLVLLLVAADGCDKKYDVVPITAAVEYQDPALLQKAWQLPVAATYHGAPALVYQKNPSFCGPASLVNVMHSLNEAAVGQDNVFEQTSFHFWNAALGMPLDRLAELVRQKSHRKVTVVRDISLAEFRAHLRRSNSPDRRYTINFHRGPLFGTGHGHHSPIGGYLEAEDLVLVLDVNQSFKPWLVRSERLYQAMDTVDSDGGRKRGMLLIE